MNLAWNKSVCKLLIGTPALLGASLISASVAFAAESQQSLFGEELLLGEDIQVIEQIAEQADVASEHITPATNTPATNTPATISLEAPAVQFAQNAPNSANASVSGDTALDAVGATDPANMTSLDQLMQYSQEGQGNTLSQVTSITQLSDVQPTDWAYQALQSLVERYGCIVGYPDGTYRGQSALTRYEFAAGLNACLDRISELIAASTADLATREDLATLQRLQEEFAAELATLRGRVDTLEARTAELEENQFSTTTKLTGEAIFAVGIPITEDDDEFSDQTIGGYRARLIFNTSFTGEDLLRIRTQAVDFENFEGFGGNVSATNWKVNGDSNDFVLDQLLYTFPVGERLQVTVGARGAGPSDFVVSTVSPFDSDELSLLGFGFPPSYYFIPGGVGAGAIVQLSENISIDFGYGADNDEAPDSSEGAGLFNGDYGVVAQLTFLSDLVDAALVYGHGYRGSGFFSDLGVETGPATSNSYGGQINFKFGALEIGGGAVYVPIRQIEVGDYDVWSYYGTLLFRDLGGEGNVLGFQAGVAPYASAVPIAAITEDFDSNQDNNIIVQGVYRFRLNDNIAIIPGVAWLSAPDNNDEIDDTVVGLVKTVFSF
ncbi:MAG: iron uptake porin [Elainellaceae cyanobacterium]